MGYANESGYTPQTIDQIMEAFRTAINTQFGTTYTTESFVGTNFYKYFYALAQRVQENEVKTSEIFAKLQDYFNETNETISRPVVTNPGLIEALSNAGYVASVKPMVVGDAGQINICVDVDDGADDYATTKLAICELIKDSTVAGCVTQGAESESITLSNGQSFDFKYHLPDRIEVDLKLTITTSENNQSVIKDPEDIKSDLISNIQARYKLGKNFEPQKYYDLDDAPWASDVLLEWSDDSGSNWYSTVYDADFDELFDYALERLTLVEN
jgi:hypothetical protein